MTAEEIKDATLFYQDFLLALGLPRGVELLSIGYCYSVGNPGPGYRVVLRTTYDLKDAMGSSLGGIVSSGEEETIDRARDVALRKLKSRVEEAARREPKPLPVSTKKASGSGPNPSLEELERKLGLR